MNRDELIAYCVVTQSCLFDIDTSWIDVSDYRQMTTDELEKEADFLRDSLDIMHGKKDLEKC